MACAPGKNITCHPAFQHRRHQSTSSPYMKRFSSKRPTASKASRRTIEKHPTKTSTAIVRSCAKKNMCSPEKNRDLLNPDASPLAEQKLFHNVGNCRHELCSVMSGFRTRTNIPHLRVSVQEIRQCI